MNKVKNKYKKQSNISKSVIATIRILLTVALVASIIMIGFFVIRDGWEAVIAWFGSSWACMFFLIILFGACAAMWIIAIYKKLKVVSENEK